MIDEYTEFALVEQQYPHIAKNLKLFWGHQDFYNIVDILLNDTRNGKRRGFPKDIATAMFVLVSKHNECFPHLIPPVPNPADVLWKF